MNKKMHNKKILFVTRPLCAPWDEASKNFAYDLAQHVHGFDITILTKGTLAEVHPEITQESIYTAPRFSLVQKMRLVWFLWRNARQYAVIHLLFTPTRFNARILRTLLPKHVQIIQTIATVREDLYNDAQLRKIFFGDVLVTYSRHAHKQITKLLDLEVEPPSRVQQIYPGLDLTKFAPGPKDPALMDAWHISPSDLVVTYPGEFVRLGATDLIINALIELWSDPHNAHIKYLCACRIKNNADAVKKNEVIERLRAVGHLDKVIFTDTFGDMNAVYNLSDIVLFPVTNMRGKFDVPLAMIEPYACKKPVIASDLTLFDELSSDAISVIIPSSDEGALVHAIAALAADTERRAALGAAAYAFAHKTFTIDRIATQYATLYEQILTKPDKKNRAS